MNSSSDRNLRGFKRTRYLAEAERCRLLYGPYEPPLVKGGFLVDEVRGKVKFSHFTNAPIPWPKYQKTTKGGSGGYVLCGDLIRALTHEAAPAVAYHWGVSLGSITNWRRALELRGINAGSHRLIAIGVELARRPEGRAKISLANRGRKISRQHKSRLMAAMKAGWKERFQARRAAYRKTRRFPEATKSDPWIPEEEELLRQYPTAMVARIIKRTPQSIQARRIFLGIRAPPTPTRQPWNQSEIKLLGTDMDRVIARMLKRSTVSVSNKRLALGIKRRQV